MAIDGRTPTSLNWRVFFGRREFFWLSSGTVLIPDLAGEGLRGYAFMLEYFVICPIRNDHNYILYTTSEKA